jgi:hypothetical protein
MATVHAYREPAPPSLIEHPDVKTLFSWIKSEEKQSPQRVVFINPRVLTFETGIPAMAPIYARSARVINELEKLRITDVILGDLGTGEAAEGVMRQLISDMPTRFTLRYENPSFKVYHFARLKGERPVTR